MGFVEAERGQTGVCRVHVKVVPGAKRSRVVGLLGDRLKIQVAAPPEDGKANAAVAQVLAEALRLDSSRVQLISGATNPRKTFRVGLDAAQVEALLSQAGA